MAFMMAILGDNVAKAAITDSIVQYSIKQSPQDTALVNKLLELSYHGLKSEEKSEIIFSLISKANELSRQLNYEWGKGRGYYLLGKFYISQINYPAAMENFTLAAKVFESVNDKNNFALTQMQLGIVLYTQKQFGEALPYFESGAEDLLLLKDSLNAATCRYLGGLANFENRNYSESEKMLKQALAEFESLNNTQRIMETRLGLANLYLEMKNVKLAEQNLDACKLYLLTNPVKDIEMAYNTYYGKASILKNDFNKAEYYFNEGYKMAKELKSLQLMLLVTKPMAEMYKQKKEFDKAFLYQEEYYKVKDSIFTLDNSRAIASLQNINNLEKQKSEILLLNKKVELERVVRFALIAVAITFILFAFNWYQKSQKIKISNTKLSESNAELAMALSNLKSAQVQLLHSEKMASLGRLTAGIAHEIKNPLNFVINFSNISMELVDEYSISTDTEEKKELLKDIKSNIEKIFQHGTRADKIMQNMLQHSRTGTGQRKPTDINKLCDDYLDFAYQSMRANNSNYKCTIIKSLQKDIPDIIVEPQDMSRVILNLLNNAMYAVMQEDDPIVEVITTKENNTVKVQIRDNGKGISAEIKRKIFEPFFTTKPTGEGTGLGLSICYDIVVAHNGSLTVDSEEGEYSNFIIELPI